MFRVFPINRGRLPEVLSHRLHPLLLKLESITPTRGLAGETLCFRRRLYAAVRDSFFNEIFKDPRQPIYSASVIFFCRCGSCGGSLSDTNDVVAKSFFFCHPLSKDDEALRNGCLDL